MILSDYLGDNPVAATVLFTDRVSNANAIIRQLNNSSGMVCANLRTSTVCEYARETVTAYIVYNEPETMPVFRFISPQAGIYILMNILRAKEFASFRSAALSRATVRDIMKCMNEIRANGLTDAGRKSDDPKLKDLQKVIDLYEEELKKRSLFDDIRTVTKAIEYLKTDNVDEWMFSLKDTKYMVLADDCFSLKERELMQLLASFSDCDLMEAEYIPEFAKANIHAAYSVYRCYGISNEVRYAIDQIHDSQNHSAKLPYDAVSVYYSNPRYINFIKAAFDASHIPYTIRSGNPAVELNIIRFMLSCLECADNDMLYAYLEMVVLNPLATFKNISEDNVISNPVRAYYNGLNAGIGWGRARYQDYIENAGNGADPYFICFLKDYIDIFDEKNSCADILSKLKEFTDKYTFKQNPDKRLVKEGLQKQINNLKYLDGSSYAISDKIAAVREAVEGLTVSDDADENSVSICSIDDACILERPVNFFLGMSSGDFSLDAGQSPVLPDNEKTDYIEGAGSMTGTVDLAGQKNARRKLALKKSLISLENNGYKDAQVIFTYLFYDTTSLRDSSPAVVLYEIERETGCVESKAEGYENWDSFIREDIKISASDMKGSIKDRAEKIRQERKDKQAKKLKRNTDAEEPENTVRENEEDETPAEEYYDVKQLEEEKDKEITTEKEMETDRKVRNISASGLQVMLACPLKYYYRYICHLKDVQQMTPESHVWLGAAQKGTLCHRLMESYFSEVMPPSRDIVEEKDVDTFNRLFDEELVKILKEQPYPSEPIKKLESDYYRKLNARYLDIIHKEWYDDSQKAKKWKVIGCEINFGKGYLNPDGEILIYKGRYGEEEYEMPIDGSIDRLDGYLNGNTLRLRIVDYKTGRLESKKEEVDLGIQIQHYMYAMAAIDHLKSDVGKKRLTEIFGAVPSEYEFESICYAFPYEADPKKILETVEDVKPLISGGPDIGDMKVDFPDDISRQIVNTISRWNSQEQVVSADLLEQEIQEKVNKKYRYLYDEAVKKAQAANPNADKPNYKIIFGQKEFCEKNYCPYKSVCRKWVDAAANENTEEEDA